MKVFYIGKDGGQESNVTGFWLIEWKRFLSIAFLRFSHGSRESFHSHAFDCVSWLLSGRLMEEHISGLHVGYNPSVKPIVTRRNTFHRVWSTGTSWVLTFRGPWAKHWEEFDPCTKQYSKLASGRNVVNVSNHNHL